MNILLGVLVIFITAIIFSIVFSIIVLSLFFGIPNTIKMKKNGLLKKEADVSNFLATACVWIIFTIIIVIIANTYMSSELFGDFIVGLFFALIMSFKSLSKENYEANIQDFFKVQRKYIDYERFEQINELYINSLNNKN